MRAEAGTGEAGKSSTPPSLLHRGHPLPGFPTQSEFAME